MSEPNPRPIPHPAPPSPPTQPPRDDPGRKGAGTLVWILLLIALLAFGWYFFNQRGAETPVTDPVAPPAVDIGSEQDAAAERERQAAAEREAREAATEDEPTPAAVADRDPAPLTRVEPEYPPAAARAREEGTVLVTANIDAQGKPMDVAVTQRSGSRELDRAAVAAVRQWTFEPAIRGGQPAASQVEVPVEFSLDR